MLKGIAEMMWQFKYTPSELDHLHVHKKKYMLMENCHQFQNSQSSRAFYPVSFCLFKMFLCLSGTVWLMVYFVTRITLVSICAAIVPSPPTMPHSILPFNTHN